MALRKDVKGFGMPWEDQYGYAQAVRVDDTIYVFRRHWIMKQTWHGHSAFRIEAGEAKILIDPFLSDNPSRDNGWSGYLTGKNSTQGGDR